MQQLHICHYAYFAFNYRFKLLATKLSQTYLIRQHFCFSAVSTIARHKPESHKTTNKKHLLSVSLPHFLHISIKSPPESEKPNMLTLPEEKLTKYVLCYQMNNYVITVGIPGLFPSMASFFLRQFVQRKGPSHGFDVGEK